MIVLDTSFLYALLDRRDGRHDSAATWYEDVDDEFVTTPLVLAELDHLAVTRAGPPAAQAVRRDIVEGAYGVEWWSTAAADATRIADRYSDSLLGLTDASLVALAGRAGTDVIATFDERHFRIVRPLRGASEFTLAPLDL